MTAPVEMIMTPDELENQLAYLVHGVSDDRAMAQAKISRHCKDLRAALTASEKLTAHLRTWEPIEAQHMETGRNWNGPRGALPKGFVEVGNASGIPGPTCIGEEPHTAEQILANKGVTP